MIDKFQGNTKWLSNFQEVTFNFKGIEWPTTEHAYQAMKCKNTLEFLNVLNAATPGEAKRLGGKCEMFPLFENYKIDIMYEINKCKFDQNMRLQMMLIGTGSQELIEGNAWGDRFWGVYEGEGRNELGKILMRIRSEL